MRAGATSRLTPEGLDIGREALHEFTPQGREYATAPSKFVRSLSFNELVAKIYGHYPDMKVNSVFR
jgi:uncharacterized protein